MTFLADRTLGRLARWLRTLGYDTSVYPGQSDRSFLEEARKEGRVALSRKRELAQRTFRGTLIVIRTDRVRDQVRELLDCLGLKPKKEKIFTICLDCNEPLQDISKESIQDAVPEYVFATQDSFRICPKCRKIYWPATHREHALEFLKDLIGRNDALNS